MTDILIIKHSALGDIFLATAAIRAIREHFPDSKLSVLTSEAFAPLMRQMPYFDQVLVDPRPKLYQIRQWQTLWHHLRSRPFEWVFDLQTSGRSTRYGWFLPSPRPNLSSLHRFASHRHHTPERTQMHTLERQQQQLAIAGIHYTPMPDVSWLEDSSYSLPEGKYALLIPGCSAHRLVKRWPPEYYAAIAQALSEQGIIPILIGTQAESDALDHIKKHAPASIHLGGQTSLAQIATLARGALFCVGNDTGPMHLAAMTGSPTLGLYSHASDPRLAAPRGIHAMHIQVHNLQDLPPKQVLERLAEDGLIATPEMLQHVY